MRATMAATALCAGVLGGLIPTLSEAVEGTLGLYSLGSGAVGAGQTPPEGVYFSFGGGYAQFKASRPYPYAGLIVLANAYSPVFVGNLLMALPGDFLGGRLSVSGTTGVAGIQFGARIIDDVVSLGKTVHGWGATDSNLRVSIGWDIGPTFSHKFSITGYLPSGRYDKGFYPNIGLNRVGTDISWGATFIEPTMKIELSGTAGYTVEGYNHATDYRSGNALHFEEGLSKHFDNGFRLGVVAYQYLQMQRDVGQPAALGPFRTRAAAVGPSASYTTLISGHIVSFTAQATHEVAKRNRLRETSGTLTTTVKF